MSHCCKGYSAGTSRVVRKYADLLQRLLPETVRRAIVPC